MTTTQNQSLCPGQQIILPSGRFAIVQLVHDGGGMAVPVGGDEGLVSFTNDEITITEKVFKADSRRDGRYAVPLPNGGGAFQIVSSGYLTTDRRFDSFQEAKRAGESA